MRSRRLPILALGLPLLGAVLAALLPDPAWAGYCYDLADCVQNNAGDGRWMLTGAGVVGGVIAVLMGDSIAPEGAKGGPMVLTPEKEEPVDAAQLQKDIDAAKARFEALQQALKDETAKQLRQIDKFQADYDALWRQAIEGTEDYMRHYPEIMRDMEALVEAAAGREMARKYAEWADIAVQAELALFAPAKGVVNWVRSGTTAAGKAATVAAVRESEALIAGRRAATAAESEAAGVRLADEAAAARRAEQQAAGKVDDAAAARKAEEEAAAARKAADDAETERLAKQMDEEQAARAKRKAEKDAADAKEAAEQAEAERFAKEWSDEQAALKAEQKAKREAERRAAAEPKLAAEREAERLEKEALEDMTFKERREYMQRKAIQQGRQAQQEAQEARAAGEKLRKEALDNQDQIMRERVDAEWDIAEAKAYGRTPTPDQLRRFEEAKMREMMEPINRGWNPRPGDADLPNITTNCYETSLELDRTLAREAAAKAAGKPVPAARTAVPDYAKPGAKPGLAKGDATHAMPQGHAFHDVALPNTVNKPVAGLQEVEGMLQQPGSRGIVQVRWKDGSGGHVFNAVNRDGHVLFVDPQTGKMFEGASLGTDWKFRQTWPLPTKP